MFPLEFEDVFGGKIKCTRERWDHIVSRHPETEEYFDHFSEVLYDPDIIISSRMEPSTRLFHRKYSDLYLVLVVNKEKSFIITAYISYRIKIGEIEWQKE